jgi:hypothetical protein
MSRIIQARIDAETEVLLSRLQLRLGWNDSQIVREGIKALGILSAPSRRRKIVGVGKFSSGKADLASNKKHLKGFGR